MSIRVLLVEDNATLRGALSAALSKSADLVVIGEAFDGTMALEQTHRLAPEVIVLDVHLPDFSGIEVAERLQRIGCPAKIVALSAYSDKRFVTAMLHSGASGYVTKSSAGTELIAAIRSAVTGERYLCSEVAAMFAPQMLVPLAAEPKAR